MDGDRVNGDFSLGIEALDVPGYGESGFEVAMRFTGVDGAALGQMVQKLDDADDQADPQVIRALLQGELEAILAAGLELHVDRFDFDLPPGPVALKMRFTVPDSGKDEFDLTSLLMTLDAEADLTASAGRSAAKAMKPRISACCLATWTGSVIRR